MRLLSYFVLNIFSGLFNFLSRKKLKVLAYHDVIDEHIFEGQIQYLTTHYNIIRVEDLYSHLYNGIGLPDYPMLITFDDGDISVYERGISILEKYQVPSCIFIISGLINTNKNYWTNTIRIKERQKGKNPKQIQKVIRSLKTMTNKERLQILEGYGDTEKIQLTDSQLRELQKSRMVIANHSHTHPMFNRCSEEEIVNELCQFKSHTKIWNVGWSNVFAYPNGNFDTASENILKKNGVEMAFLFDHKVNKEKIDPMKISRIRVNSDTPLGEFKVKTSGLHPNILKLKSWLNK